MRLSRALCGELEASAHFLRRRSFQAKYESASGKAGTGFPIKLHG